MALQADQFTHGVTSKESELAFPDRPDPTGAATRWMIGNSCDVRGRSRPSRAPRALSARTRRYVSTATGVIRGRAWAPTGSHEFPISHLGKSVSVNLINVHIADLSGDRADR